MQNFSATNAKVISVCHILFLQDKPQRHIIGGAERHVLDTLPRLAAQGLDVELLLVAWTPGPRIDAIAEQLRQARVRVELVIRHDFRNLPSKIKQSLACLGTLLKALRERRKTRIHFHLDHWFVPLLLLAVKAPHVYFTFHNDEAFYKRRWFKLWFNLTMPKRYSFVAISENVRSFVSLHLGVPSQQIALLRYGIDVAGRPSPLGSRELLNLPQNSFLIAFIGRLVPQKNLFRFCQALKLVPQAHGVLLGAGPLEAELREFAIKEQINNLSFVGPIDEASRYMHLFDLICLPSVHEGLGLVLLEAMAAGVPACGAHAGAIPEVLGQGELGSLFSPLDPASMAECFGKALQNPEQIKNKALRAQQVVQECYAPSRVVEEYLRLYSADEAKKAS